MVSTVIMSYTERFTPDEALATNRPGGIKAIRRAVLEDIATLRSAKESFERLGMKEEAKWCFDGAVRMAKWLVKFGAFDKEETP